jgi:hypothetical protein
MTPVSRLLRDYSDAAALNSVIALWGFVDDTTFVTKSGHVGVVYGVRGQDAEGLTHDQRRVAVHRFEAALRLLDERCRVYQYVIKQHVEPFVSPPCGRAVAEEALRRRAAYLNDRRQRLFTTHHFMVILYESPGSAGADTLTRLWRSPRRALREWLSLTATCQLLEADLDSAIEILHHKARALEVQLAGVS